jgi:CheY-like chemotaxis protein
MNRLFNLFRGKKNKKDKNNSPSNPDIKHPVSLPIEKNVLKNNIHLICDDSESNRMVLSKYLTREKYLIDEASNGNDAIEKIKKNGTYSIIWMDIMMPRMNGFDCTEILRKQYNYSGVIIGLTGLIDQDSVDECLKRGMNHVIGKPIDKTILYHYAEKYTISNNPPCSTALSTNTDVVNTKNDVINTPPTFNKAIRIKPFIVAPDTNMNTNIEQINVCTTKNPFEIDQDIDSKNNDLVNTKSLTKSVAVMPIILEQEASEPTAVLEQTAVLEPTAVLEQTIVLEPTAVLEQTIVLEPTAVLEQTAVLEPAILEPLKETNILEPDTQLISSKLN